jgi:transcriptional regulator with XRE-family HTH domain
MQAALRRAQMTQSELARRARVSQPSVTNWCNGRTQVIRGDKLFAVANKLGVRAEWLQYGTGHMLSESQRPDERLHDAVAADNVRRLLAGTLTEPEPGTLAAQVQEYAAAAVTRAVHDALKDPRAKLTTFAERVRDLIDRRGLTGAEVARRCGISKQTIGLILEGESSAENLRVSTLEALARELTTTWEYLLHGVRS